MIDRLRKSTLAINFPRVRDAFFLASCEEEYDENINDYSAFSSPDVEVAFKEHVVVGLKICINGRFGVVILDTGYHVAKPVTVMEDCGYPHTGWFVQTKSAKVTKRYNYQLHGNGKYVIWQVQEMRDGILKSINPSIIYAHRRFVNCVDLVERRNLVYGFRVWVTRNELGDLIAGFYFPVKRGGCLTMFCNNEEGKREEWKIPFSYFQSLSNINSNYERGVSLCANHMKKYTRHLRELLLKISCILHDEEFIDGVLGINNIIES